MSWAEVKKINSNMSQPLDVSIPKIIKNLILGGYVWSIEPGQQTLSVPSGIETIYITASGAGGGGGGSIRNSSSNTDVGGGGGGRGQQIANQKASISSSDISAVIGAGGVAGISKYAAEYTSSASAGANGGQTTLLDIVLTGGMGGTGGTLSGSNGTSGAGGSIGGANGEVNNYSGQTANGGNGGVGQILTSGNGGKGGGTIVAHPLVTQPEAGKNGIVIITWGALRFDDVKTNIQTAINNGATHGSDED